MTKLQILKAAHSFQPYFHFEIHVVPIIIGIFCVITFFYIFYKCYKFLNHGPDTHNFWMKSVEYLLGVVISGMFTILVYGIGMMFFSMGSVPYDNSRPIPYGLPHYTEIIKNRPTHEIHSALKDNQQIPKLKRKIKYINQHKKAISHKSALDQNAILNEKSTLQSELKTEQKKIYYVKHFGPRWYNYI